MPKIKDLYYDKHIARLEYENDNLTRAQFLAITKEIDRRIHSTEHVDCDCQELINKYTR